MSHPIPEESPGSLPLQAWLARAHEVLAPLGARLAHEARTAWERWSGGSALLRQGRSALERGNVEAAFWLLREEVAARPDAPLAVQAFWDAAVSCGRAEAAAAAMSRQVQRQAKDHPEVAAESWIVLEAASPDAPMDAITLARMLPALKARVAASASDEARRGEAEGWVLRALRRCVEPGSGLAGGVALRVFQEARPLDPAVARSAAAIALTSPHLHEAKRALLERYVGEGAAAAPPG